jgi:hypothetical protein
MRTQTSVRTAPVPLASARAIRGSSSSFAYALPTRSENSERTSYGVARFPYTSRSANRCARRRSGWNASATTAAAPAESNGLVCPPTIAPTPTTIATYTTVMNTASAPNRTARFTTTSMSKSR